MRSDFSTLTLKMLAFAALYVALFHAFFPMMSWAGAAELATLFYPPAFVRLFGFMIIGFWIIPALLLANLILVTTGAYDLGPGYGPELTMAIFTAFGGPLGAYVSSRITQLHLSLDNLTPKRLVHAAIGCAIGNAIAFRLALLFSGAEQAPLSLGVRVFVGDVLGTLAIIYAIKFTLTLCLRRA